MEYVEQPGEDKIEERYKLKGYNNFYDDITEDGEAGPAVGAATLDSVPGMGEPVLAGRGITGSGDVPSPKIVKKKSKKKRVKSFDQFIKK